MWTQIKERNFDKKFIVPAHEYTYITYMIVGKVHIPQYNTSHIPEKFCVLVSGKDGDKAITETFELYETDYNNKAVGDSISFE